MAFTHQSYSFLQVTYGYVACLNVITGRILRVNFEVEQSLHSGTMYDYSKIIVADKTTATLIVIMLISVVIIPYTIPLPLDEHHVGHLEFSIHQELVRTTTISSKVVSGPSRAFVGTPVDPDNKNKQSTSLVALLISNMC